MSAPRCRSCGAAIVWGKTGRGKRIPLDPAPSDDGNISFDRDLELAVVLTEDALAAARFNGEPLYLTHFTTCPNAQRHRRR